MTKKEIALVDELMKTPKKSWNKLNPCAPWHGQAFSLEKDGYCICISYKTPIAMKTNKGEFIRLWNGYSKTSMGHLSSWCIDNQMPIVNGKTWDKLIIGRKYSNEKLLKLI